MKAKPKGKVVAVMAGANRVGLAVEVLGSLLQQVVEYRKIVAAEQTKQEQIRAQRDAILAQFAFRRDLLLTVADKVFAERRETLTLMFSNLERAIETGDAATVGQVLSAVVIVVKHSPLADIQALAAEISREDYTLDLS